MRVSSAEERFQWAYDIVKMIMEYTPDFGKEGADMRDATRQALAQAGVPLVVRHQFLGNRWAPQTALRSLTRTAVCDCDCGWVWACPCACWRACKKCRQTPIFMIPLSPHYLYLIPISRPHH